MGEFKVGDKVRYHDENVSGIGVVHGLARDGVYLVNVETKDLDWAYYVKNTCREFAERNLTPVSTWQPKVGDRVRYSGKSTTYSEAKLVGLEGVVTNVGTELATVKWDKEVVSGIRTGGDKYITNIEPIATLSIEAGKFYKTRDGRKVGPLKTWHALRDELCEVVGDGRYWTLDGVGHNKAEGEDLIAELVDEPAAQSEMASNDNAEPTANPKFKVGDRVKTKGDFTFDPCLGTVTDIDGDLFIVSTDDHGENWSYYESELDLFAPSPAIVALIENGAAKPATRPKVHPDQAGATTEAERLALAYPGQQFGVFVLADSKIADVVNVPTAVLRAA